MKQAFILLLNFNHQGEGSEKATTEILAEENAPVARQPVIFLLHKSSHSFCRMWAPAVSRVRKRRAFFKVSDCDSCTYCGSAWPINAFSKYQNSLKSRSYSCIWCCPGPTVGMRNPRHCAWSPTAAHLGLSFPSKAPAVTVYMLLLHFFWQETETFKRQGECRLLTLI